MKICKILSMIAKEKLIIYDLGYFICVEKNGNKFKILDKKTCDTMLIVSAEEANQFKNIESLFIRAMICNSLKKFEDYRI